MQDRPHDGVSPGRGGGHTFHIPVMGTGFTVDTPLRVAKYGISSVISLVDDVLIEQMRGYHCGRERLPYEPIADGDEDARARRIAAYLDLIDQLVQRDVAALRQSGFAPDSELTRYYEMLPDGRLKQAYLDMLAMSDPARKAKMQQRLAELARPGSIDVNIMTKLDRDLWRGGQKLPPEYADAMSALRGFALSGLRSSMVFSAGMNQRLYTYAAQFDDFFPDAEGQFRKRIVLKVSDYRSAAIQGRFLAKRGLWVSEYRIESGLNCGGHAFATKGLLLGPILEEFKEHRASLAGELLRPYAKTLAKLGRPAVSEPPAVRITVQGGISTAGENELMLECYGIDGTGWATPFLLVPDVVNVDGEQLEKLCAATDNEVYMSDASPLSVPYWNLRTSASEDNRRRLIREGRPGSLCPKHYAMLNGEFTKVPICLSSRAYQKRKLEQLNSEPLAPGTRAAAEEDILNKSCICHDLAGGATLKHGLDPDATPAVCCGPNIADFSRVASLSEMVSHIYGRLSLLTRADRPHVFIREIGIYADHLRRELAKFSMGLSASTPKYFREFKENLLGGIDYYRRRIPELLREQRRRFLDDLEDLREAIDRIVCLDAPLAAAEAGVYVAAATEAAADSSLRGK